MKSTFSFAGRLLVALIVWPYIFGVAALSARDRQTLSYWQAYRIDLRFEANCLMHYVTQNYKLFIF